MIPEQREYSEQYVRQQEKESLAKLKNRLKRSAEGYEGMRPIAMLKQLIAEAEAGGWKYEEVSGLINDVIMSTYNEQKATVGNRFGKPLNPRTEEIVMSVG